MQNVGPRLSTHWLVIALFVVFAGIAGGALQARISERSRWAAPAGAVQRANPLAGRFDVEPGGDKLFQQRCATCHGRNGRGSERAPNLATARVQAQTDGALFWKISGGNTRTGMPTFSFLPELQRWQLVLKVRALRSR
jgi:mono/diheme cytochrome c family protein